MTSEVSQNAMGVVLGRSRNEGIIITAANLLPSAIYAGFLFFPVVVLALHGSTLTGMYEESVGYRYFYTLRSLYEGSYLFLPQGELVNLIFKAIHLVLTAVGHPTTELFPRIDYFTYAGIAALHLVTVACFWWGTKPIARISSKIAAATFWALLYYIPQTSAVYAIIQPDYIVLFPALSLLVVGVILRIRHRLDWSPRLIGGFALFVGAALSVKLTLAILPCIALLHAVIMSRKPLVGLAASALAVLLGGACWCFVLFIELGAFPSFVSRHFVGLLQFMNSSPGISANDLPWTKWIVLRVSQPPPLLAAIYTAPILAALSFVFARERWEASAIFSFLIGLVAYGFFLFKRDYPITALECLFPVAALLTTVAQFVFFSPVRALRWTIIPVLTFGLIWYYPIGVGSLIGSADYNTEEQNALRAIESKIHGKLLWLVETNNERPLAVDSAIMKGGYAYSGQWLDPPSAIMRSMFPNRDFRFYVDPGYPVNLNDLAAVMFIYQGDLEKEAERTARAYSTSFSGWSCGKAASISSYPVALCEPGK